MNKSAITEIVKYTKNLNVLFIEDDDDSRIQTLKMFENLFNNITTATDGIEGLTHFQEFDFDIIFSDINMPKLNGLEFIEKVREKDKNIPIVMISAYDNTPYLLKCIEQGVEGYLVKPIEIKQFLTILQKIIDKIYNTSNKNIVYLEGGFLWNENTKKLSKEQEITLTANEIKFLDFLISAKGVVKTYIEIDLYVFDDSLYNDRKIRNLVARLRKKIGYDFLESIYGYGYRVKLIS